MDKHRQTDTHKRTDRQLGGRTSSLYVACPDALLAELGTDRTVGGGTGVLSAVLHLGDVVFCQGTVGRTLGAGLVHGHTVARRTVGAPLARLYIHTSTLTALLKLLLSMS